MSPSTAEKKATRDRARGKLVTFLLSIRAPATDGTHEAGSTFFEHFRTLRCHNLTTMTTKEEIERLKETCQRLERERDEAREDLEFRRELYALQTERLQRIERERDEARAVVRELWDMAEVYLPELTDEQLDRIHRSGSWKGTP